jgi:hypothetical protein
MTQQLSDMQTPAESCNSGTCPEHFHADDQIFSKTESRQRPRPVEKQSTRSEGHVSDSTDATLENEKKPAVELQPDPEDHVVRRTIRNFAPSYVYRLQGQVIKTAGKSFAD